MSLTKGQVFRKNGPCDWMRVERVLIPGHPEYDGALPGVSVRRSDSGGRGWKKRGWFVPAANDQDFIDHMHRNFRFLAEAST